jgi:protein phosphatase
MRIELPEPSLVVLIGVTGSGKSTFAARHFKPTEILSSDFCRGLVSDDENDQAATTDAFAVLHFIAHRRLPWRSCSTCRRPSATRATRHAPTGPSAGT